MTESSGTASPRSIISRIDQRHLHLKASQVLTMLATLLASPTHYQKFIAALPAARIYLLLLGERPTPVIATQILRMIVISLKASSSFNRKFELASGWSILKTVLPFGWCQEAQEAAFDVLFGEVVQGGERHVVTCAHIVPPLLGVLQLQLDVITGLNQHDHCYDGENIMICPRCSILLTETLCCFYQAQRRRPHKQNHFSNNLSPFIHLAPPFAISSSLKRPHSRSWMHTDRSPLRCLKQR